MSDEFKSRQIIYVDGAFCPAAEAKINVLDHGILHGDSVFDTCLSYHGVIFRWQAHVDRLFESAKAVEITIPLSKEELAGVVCETVRRNGLSDAYIKVVVTRGAGLYPTLQPEGCKPSVIVFAQPYTSVVAEGDEPPAKSVWITTVRRIPSQCVDAKIKGSYLNHVLAYLEARRAGADWGVEMTVDGYICEATGANVWIVKDGRLLTPGEDILVGVTRAAVFDLAKALQIPASVERLTPVDLYLADEMFFSSTSGGIIPINKVNGRPVGEGVVGPITKRIRRAYLNLLASGKDGLAFGT